MNPREQLISIFKENRQLAERNPDLAAEVLANPAFPAPVRDSGSGKPTLQTSTELQREAAKRPQAPHRDYKSELLQQLSLLGISPPKSEFTFHPSRKWRFDWAYPAKSGRGGVAVEYDGGFTDKSTGARSGHRSVSGIMRDIEKFNEAQILGWLVVRVGPMHVVSGKAVEWIEAALRSRRKRYADRLG